ncbi:hypothetical protein G9A89_009260 [Geosiphon pyriformis]|nr:hypothetical protein G9A89_009260 [Geosiphon pyriformis]
MEDQGFDKSTLVERGDIEQISQPSKQTKSNIPPATITENTTLAAIFPFDIDNLNTYSFFSGAAINQDKPIMALYTNARVRGIDIKLILDSRSANSIITKQLMDQLVGNDWLLKANATFDWNIQELQLTFNGQHAEVPAMCGHFKTQRTEEPLIEFEDTLMPPTIKTYQVSWVVLQCSKATSINDVLQVLKKKGRAKEKPQSSLLGYVTSDQRNLFYQLPRLICVDCGKKLSTMDTYIGNNKKWPTATKYYCRPYKWDNTSCLACGEILPDKRLWNDVPGRERTCDEELVLTRKEQKQKLANLNTKLCDHCLIPCHFQYCDKCDLMFNLPPRILFPITELPEPKKEVLITEDMLFQDPTEDTETKQYLTYSNLSKELELKWYSDNEERICPERAHNTDAKSQEKIAQAIFLPLVKTPQLTPITTQEKLGLTAQGINGFESSGRGNLPVNFTEEDSDQIQDQALLFEASPKICSLANVANLYLPVKVHKHFKIPIHNPTEDVIKIPEGTLISSISIDIQNSEKPQSIPDFAQLFLFCDITSQYTNVFASENEFGHIDIIKHQIDTEDTRLIKQQLTTYPYLATT